jgi:cytochrome b6-f complex iron-sulfur subunit
VIRPHDDVTTSGAGILGRIKRRQLLRLGFLSGTVLALTELTVLLYPFLKPNKIVGLGAKVPVGSKESVLAAFQSAQDAPILNSQGRFFLLHPEGGIIAAYRKCTHLGCAVPYVPAENRFHCPCHGSIYNKKTAVVEGGPAPKPLQLFHITDVNGTLVVDTNPLNVIDRTKNEWDPSVIEITA